MAAAAPALVHNTRPRTPLEVFMGNVITIEDRDEIKRTLPRHVSYERFERNLTNAIMMQPNLLKCPPRQVLREVMKIAALGLVIDAQLGEAYLITGWSKDGPLPQIRIGYRGLLKLARQSGDVAKIYAHEVCANDKVAGKLGTNKFLEHEPDLFGDRGEVIGFYAVVQFKDGETDFEPMNIAQVNAIRDRSDGWKAFTEKRIKDTPWASSYDEMGKKTVIRRLLKRCPQSPDLAQAFNLEDQSENAELAAVAVPRALPLRNPLADDEGGPVVEQQADQQDGGAAQEHVDVETGEVTPADQQQDVAERPTAATEAPKPATEDTKAKPRAARAPRAAEKQREQAAATTAEQQPATAEPATEESPHVVFIKACATVQNHDQLEALRDRHKAWFQKAKGTDDFKAAERAYVSALDRLDDEERSRNQEQAHGDANQSEASAGAAEAGEAGARQADAGTAVGQGDRAADAAAGAAPVEDAGERQQISSGEARVDAAAGEASAGPAPVAESWSALIPPGEWSDRQFKKLRNTAKGLFGATTLTDVRDVADSYREVAKLDSEELQEAWLGMIKAREDMLKATGRPRG